MSDEQLTAAERTAAPERVRIGVDGRVAAMTTRPRTFVSIGERLDALEAAVTAQAARDGRAGDVLDVRDAFREQADARGCASRRR